MLTFLLNLNVYAKILNLNRWEKMLKLDFGAKSKIWIFSLNVDENHFNLLKFLLLWSINSPNSEIHNYLETFVWLKKWTVFGYCFWRVTDEEDHTQISPKIYLKTVNFVHKRVRLTRFEMICLQQLSQVK